MNFLAHFPALKRMEWHVRDEISDDGHTDFSDDIWVAQPGSFTVPIKLLQPVAKSLTKLDLNVKTFQAVETMEFLAYLFPCVSFEKFQSLQYLRKLCNHPALVLKSDKQAIRDALTKSGASNPTGDLSDIQHAPKLQALRYV